MQLLSWTLMVLIVRILKHNFLHWTLHPLPFGYRCSPLPAVHTGQKACWIESGGNEVGW